MRITRMKGLVLAAATVLACAATVAPVSAADAVAGVLDGSGVLSPPMQVTGGSGTFTFTGSLTGTAGGSSGVDVLVGESCTFSGTWSGSLAESIGSYSGSCFGSASITISASFVRVGLTETDSGTATVNGSPTVYALICVWLPQGVPNPTGYQVICVWP